MHDLYKLEKITLNPKIWKLFFLIKFFLYFHSIYFSQIQWFEYSEIFYFWISHLFYFRLPHGDPVLQNSESISVQSYVHFLFLYPKTPFCKKWSTNNRTRSTKHTFSCVDFYGLSNGVIKVGGHSVGLLINPLWKLGHQSFEYSKMSVDASRFPAVWAIFFVDYSDSPIFGEQLLFSVRKEWRCLSAPNRRNNIWYSISLCFFTTRTYNWILDEKTSSILVAFCTIR